MAFLARTWQRVADPATVHVFNTFFYPQFAAHGYDRVRTWLRAPASRYRLLVVPINFNYRHWALATIESHGPILSMYDSLPSSASAEKVLRTLAAYLEAEAHDPAKHTVPDEAGPVDPITVPAGDSLDHMALRQPRHGCTQTDGSSCGVFAVAFGVCKMFGLPVAPTTFAQRMQAAFRRRMAYELVGNIMMRFGAAPPTSVPCPPRRVHSSGPAKAPDTSALAHGTAAAKEPVGTSKTAAAKTTTRTATKKEQVLDDTAEDPLAPPTAPLQPPSPPLTKEPLVAVLSAAGTATTASPASTVLPPTGAPPTPSPLIRSHRARAHRRKIESKR
ncbi:hypothetical protein AMAG_13333 [Allomyces macrogynus ATCC 38327]|uniref:Ubiquitin-like protease family profile domain-containing protein n=1 Tax=Allomyces macrogynus (strain ATCC 38327) TaxID=578462 RepID=A0A0L0T072_ALLM3|nr:hypothetical protein AMAG_13333 [Allomyces macrogynus ATCC 38327]|eukprot:KNE68171.1 hypothetical protein AMAG_13333 [Allomyces macrogynus ATCC 38327]